MRVSERVADGLRRELRVTIEAEELDARLNARLAEIRNAMRPLERRPLPQLRALYGRSLLGDVVAETVAQTVSEILEARSERPAMIPSIVLPEDDGVFESILSGGADLEVAVAYEILPAIEPVDFAEIAIERETAEITAEVVEQGLQQLRHDNPDYETKVGVAELGDRVVVDAVATIGGEPVEDGTIQDLPVVVSEHIDDESNLLGVRAGDVRTIIARFPDSYPNEGLAGTTAVFSVTVKNVERPIMPALDDAFARRRGMETLDGLRQAVRDDLAIEVAAASREKTKRTLFDALCKAHDFALPPTLVETEFDTIWAALADQLQRAGRTFEEEGTSEERMRELYRRLAEHRVRAALVLREIGRRNGIGVEGEDLRDTAAGFARRSPQQGLPLMAPHEQGPAFWGMIIQDKVVDFILERVKITEKAVSVRELLRFMEWLPIPKSAA
jgi:trigger factor